jgi:phage terminase Nu1 subunit (DNA packaging protein)
MLKNSMVKTGELEKIVNVSRHTIIKWRKEGLPFYKKDKAVLFDPKEVIEWIKSNG